MFWPEFDPVPSRLQGQSFIVIPCLVNPVRLLERVLDWSVCFSAWRFDGGLLDFAQWHWMKGEKEMMNSTVAINLTDREQHQYFSTSCLITSAPSLYPHCFCFHVAGAEVWQMTYYSCPAAPFDSFCIHSADRDSFQCKKFQPRGCCALEWGRS